MYEQAKPRITNRRGPARMLRGLVIAASVGLLAMTPTASAGDPVEDVFDLLDDGVVEPRNTGGGFSMGAMTYVSATKLPKAFAQCARNLEFKLGNGVDPAGGWQSDAFVFNTVISGFAGPVTMTGGGRSDVNCESYSSAAGVMTVALQGKAEDNPTESTLDCRDSYGDPTKSRDLTGRYTRVLTNMIVILTGRCVVNRFATGQVTFVAVIQAVPGDPVPDDPSGGEGITRSVTTLMTTGTFTLVPA